MEYSFAPGPDGAPELGLHRAGRWDEVLPIERCWLTTDLGNAIRNAIRDWAREERLEAYDQAENKGYLRHLVIREGVNTGEALVLLVTHVRERFDRERLIEVLTQFPEVRSIHWAVNDTPAEVTNLPTELLWGAEAIEEQIGDLRFRVRPNAFLQTNTRMAERLYALAREEAALTGSETVYDLYCGIGTIGLSMARDAMTVWGVEISEESVACAIENAELNAIGNAAFFAGNVGEVLRDLRERAGEPDVVVVDPPRAGLAGKALKRLGELAAPRVVYVSCNPTTLAGDAKRLAEVYGYRLVRTTPVDMFPHTPHVESVSLLERGSSIAPAGRGRSRRQSRSAFAARNPSEMPGSAGRPDTSHQTTQIIVSAEPDSHADPRPERTQAEAHARREENGEERDVRRAELGDAAARHDERDRDAAEHLLVVLGDVVRRAPPDRVGVDERDQRRDEHDPRQLLERLQEQEPEEQVGPELADARRHRQVDLPEDHRRDEQDDDGRQSCCPGRVATGSASHAIRNVAGMSTSAIRRMLGQTDHPSTWGASSYHVTSAATSASTEAARPTRARPA